MSPNGPAIGPSVKKNDQRAFLAKEPDFHGGVLPDAAAGRVPVL